MIERDEQGHPFIRTVEGTTLPLIPVPVNIKVECAQADGTIESVWDVVATERTLAAHWFQKYQAAQTTIADLREQLNNR